MLDRITLLQKYVVNTEGILMNKQTHFSQVELIGTMFIKLLSTFKLSPNIPIFTYNNDSQSKRHTTYNF